MLLTAGLITLTAGSGLFRTADLAASDALYQSRSASDGDIVIVGIDERALEEKGPYNHWGREIFAEIIEALNRSEECHPAVIALDILCAGRTDDEGDRRLADAARKYGNVLAACQAGYGDKLTVSPDGDHGLDRGAVTVFEEPYDALRTATEQGHINACLDTDGILRHHLLYLTLPDGREVPSLALAAAQRYREYCGRDELEEPPVSGRGFWYVPYCGIPEDFEMVSAADLLSGERSADYFDGKIVLVGPYAAGLQDSYFTSADHAQPMYGVEYQANAVQALLWEDGKKEVDHAVQLWVLFAVMLLSMIGLWRRPVRFSTMLWAVICAGYVFLCSMFYRMGLVLHVLWIPAGVTVLYAGSLALNYIKEAMEKRRVTNTFKRYVAPEIVNEILKQDADDLGLGGKLTDIAVLFVDVRGFTSMSERLEPVQVVGILNQYLTLISRCILENGGTLDKFVGDAAMAFWGAPIAREDYVMHAVQAAEDMISGARKLSEELLCKYGQSVSFGIGIHTGEAVVGNIGSPQQMDYTAIGDTVNTAARLEANAPGGVIYISRAVADALKGRIKVTSLGDTVRLKGKKEGFEVLILHGITDER